MISIIVITAGPHRTFGKHAPKWTIPWGMPNHHVHRTSLSRCSSEKACCSLGVSTNTGKLQKSTIIWKPNALIQSVMYPSASFSLDLSVQYDLSTKVGNRTALLPSPSGITERVFQKSRSTEHAAS